MGFPAVGRMLASQHFLERTLEQLHGLVHVRFVDQERRHEANRALPASEQEQAMVKGARDQLIAEFFRRRFADPVRSQVPYRSSIPCRGPLR